MNFKTISMDPSYAVGVGTFISPKLNNSEWDYWLVIEVVDMWDATGEQNGQRYHATINAVSPSQAGEQNVRKALESGGVDEAGITDESSAVALVSYGVCAPIWQKSGSNARKLLRLAKRECVPIAGLFGFYMDKPLNRIGSTGWEFIKGDLNSGLARAIASGTPEGRILRKMHGIA